MKTISRWLRDKFRFFGFFYYSEKQAQVIAARSSRKNYAKQLFTGKVVRYSEWKSNLRRSNWDDAKLVAIGFVYFGEQS